MKIPEEYREMLDVFPFLTIVRSGKNEYIGIIQNQDTNVTSMYVYDRLITTEDKKKFLDLGAEWWWETNRKIPINIVLGKRFDQYRHSLMSFSNKEFEILAGPTLSLRDLMSKRVKRKSIQLIRKLD